MRDDVTDDGRAHDRHAAHGRRPALDQVSAGPSSRISWPKPCRRKYRTTSGVHRIEDSNEETAAIRMVFTGPSSSPGARPSWPPPARSRRVHATRSRLAARDPLTSTTSPARSSSAAAPAQHRCRRPSRLTIPGAFQAAPCAIGRAGSPTAISRDMSSRTASRPIASCSTAACGPSSAISPSTATVRAGGPTDRRQRLQGGAPSIRDWRCRHR